MAREFVGDPVTGEADRPVAAGYAPAEDTCPHARVYDTGLCPPCARLLRLEAKLDALSLALKAGAIGRWQ